MSLNFLSTRFRCSWPWDILVMLCDGRLVCGCADPYGQRVLGDARVSSIREVWAGETITTLRAALNQGGSSFCGDCPLKLPLKRDEQPPVRPLDAGALPGRMFIECTAACNISCTQACCAPETGITRTRQAGMLDFELFRRVIDEAGPSLGRIDFFNYGEAFLNKRAVEMCEYIKTHHPHIYLYTSTNGGAVVLTSTNVLYTPLPGFTGVDRFTYTIADTVDACPDQPGRPHPDPRKHGCPEFAEAERTIDTVVNAMITDPATRTRDLGGPLGTAAFTAAVCDGVRQA